MSEGAILITFGSILLLAAVIGGGFEIKEIRIPKIGPGARILAGTVAFVLVSLGIGMSTPGQGPVRADVASPLSTSSPHPDDRVPTPGQATESQKQVRILIRDQLGAGFLREAVDIQLEGQQVGMLDVNQAAPMANLWVTLPREGFYRYDLAARAIIEQNGSRYQIVGKGQGTVPVTAGKVFELTGSFAGTAWELSLQEVQQ